MKYRLFQRRGAYWVDFHVNGVRHRKTTGCVDRREAERKAQALVAEVLSGEAAFSSPTRPHSSTIRHANGMTFRDAYLKGMREREKWILAKDRTSIQQTYQQVVAYWGENTPLSAATREAVLKWRVAMLKEPGKRPGTTLAHSTINHRLSMLSVLLHIANLPPHGVKHLSVANNRRKRRVREEELRAVIKWMLAHAHRRGALLMADLILVGLHTTARMGELLSLRWSDVYFDRGTVVFRDTKNGETREVVLNSAAQRILEGLHKAQPEGPFVGLSKWQARALWREAREALGLGDDYEFVFHVATRHEGLSRLGEAGASAFQIKAMGGHKSIAAADRYVKPEAQTLRELAEKINRPLVGSV